MHVRSGRAVAGVAAGWIGRIIPGRRGRAAVRAWQSGAARGTAGSARARSVVLGRPGAAARSCRTAAGRPSTTGAAPGPERPGAYRASGVASPATAYMGNPV